MSEEAAGKEETDDESAVKAESEDTLEEAGEKEAADGRYPAVPEEPDPPSYAPIFTGLGIATFAWGFLTNFIILMFGLAVFVFGISIWIKELTQ